MHFPVDILHLTADRLKHNKKLSYEYSLYKTRYGYRSLKSSVFDSDHLRSLDGRISNFEQNCSKHFKEAFSGLEKSEQYLLAKTLFVPQSRFVPVCEEIADPVPMFSESDVRKEVARALLHLLGKVPDVCLVGKSTDNEHKPTLFRLIEVLRHHGVESAAA